MECHLARHVRTLKDFLIHLGIVTLGTLICRPATGAAVKPYETRD
jgi:hypothetical protein